MENAKFTAIALVVFFISLPLFLSVKKVVSYDISTNFRVSFDPITCYKCRDCTCKYTVNNGDTYILNKTDKNRCTTDHEIINKGIKAGAKEVTVEFEVPEYAKFFDCIKWYSLHPSSER